MELSRSDSRLSNVSESLLSEVSLELSQLVRNALAIKELAPPPLPKSQTPTLPHKTLPYSHSNVVHHQQGTDSDLESLRIKMDGLLRKIPQNDAMKSLANPSAKYQPSETYIARNANALSRKMEEMNGELDDIKRQLDKAYRSFEAPSLFVQPVPVKTSSSKKTEQSHSSDQDTSRFDAVPTCIRTYIREEINLMETRLLAAFEKKLQAMDKKLDKLKKSRVGLENRPSWQSLNADSKKRDTQVEMDAIDPDEQADYLLRKLQDTFRRKNRSAKKGTFEFNEDRADWADKCEAVSTNLHTRQTVASRMKNKK